MRVERSPALTVCREERRNPAFHRYDVRRRHTDRDAIRGDRDRVPRRRRLCLGRRWTELDFGDDRLRSARAHPFFTGEWKDADTLKPGAKIVRRDGALQMLYAIRDV